MEHPREGAPHISPRFLLQQPEAGGCGAQAQCGGVGLGPDFPQRLHGGHVIRGLGTAQGTRGWLVRSRTGAGVTQCQLLHPVWSLLGTTPCSVSQGLPPLPFPPPVFFLLSTMFFPFSSPSLLSLSHSFSLSTFVCLSVSLLLLAVPPLPWAPRFPNPCPALVSVYVSGTSY